MGIKTNASERPDLVQLAVFAGECADQRLPWCRDLRHFRFGLVDFVRMRRQRAWDSSASSVNATLWDSVFTRRRPSRHSRRPVCGR
jgi:hypothetical protein